MKHQLKKRNVTRVTGDCEEEDWGAYVVYLEINKVYGLIIDMPALPRRTGGIDKLPFRLVPTKKGWLAKSQFHRDFLTLNIDISEGLYHYCDDWPRKIDISWDCDFDLEKRIRSLHRMLLKNDPVK